MAEREHVGGETRVETREERNRCAWSSGNPRTPRSVSVLFVTNKYAAVYYGMQIVSAQAARDAVR